MKSEYTKDELRNAAERIADMEEIYSRAHTEIRNLENALNGFAGQEKNLESLFGWYFNGCWMKDYDLDEKGLLPSDLKRGVLSEDTIYDLYEHVVGLEDSLQMIRTEIAEILKRNSETAE